MAVIDHELGRLEALRQYEILDTVAEAAFDDLTLTASELCHTPIALLTLVDANRQWFKSAQGLEVRETHRDYAFCSHAILEPEVLVVSDAALDPRFQDNPLVVDGPRIRFYAGSPLVDRNGFALGTLCVIDTEPRQLSSSQLAALQALARSAMALIESRRIAQLLAETVKLLDAETLARDRAESQKSVLVNAVRINAEHREGLDALLPICAYCKGIQEEDGIWLRLESYIARHSNALLTHGICPGCYEEEMVKVAAY